MRCTLSIMSAVWTKMELLIDRQRRVPAKSTQQKPSSPCGPPKGFDRTYRLHIPIRQHTVIDVTDTQTPGYLRKQLGSTHAVSRPMGQNVQQCSERCGPSRRHSKEYRSRRTETYLAKSRKLPDAHTSTTRVRRNRRTQRDAPIGEPCQPMDGYSC